MAYAQDTSVPVERSKAEIERILTNYGASQFVSGWDDRANKAMVQFEMKDRRVRIMVEIPPVESFRRYIRNTRGGERQFERSDGQARIEQMKEMRRRWRSMLLVIKAKLEAVASGISTFEEEFMPYIVTASGRTIGELVLPRLDHVASSGKLPPLLPGRTED